MNPAITDIIVLVLAASFFLKGWKKGIIRSLLGPGALIICTIIAFLYYQETKNLLISLVIGILGPGILSIFLSMILKFWQSRDASRQEVSWLSEVLGGLFGMVWGGLLAVVCVMVVGMLPAMPGLEKVQGDVKQSFTYQWVRQQTPSQDKSLESITASINLADDPALLEKIQDTKELQDLREHESIQEILSDEETMKQIEDRDFVKLISNPKIASILGDKELMKKFLSLNAKIAEEKSKMKNAPPDAPFPEIY